MAREWEPLPLDAADRRLIAAAKEALRRNYRPGRHSVGAAVRCASGRIYVGVNVEACGYGPCAEPIAIGTAFTNGEQELRAIVAVARRGRKCRVLSPCGNCRQLVLDYAPDAMVIFSGRRGSLQKTKARHLLPAAYHSHFDSH